MPWEQNNSREEDLFKGFGETGERMLVAQKVVQNNDLDDHSVIPDPGKVFLSQSFATWRLYKFPWRGEGEGS